MTIILEEVKISGHPGPIEIFKVTLTHGRCSSVFRSTPKANFHADIKSLQTADQSKAKICLRF